MTNRWNPDLRAPLASNRASSVRVGDYILSINGQDLKAPDNIYRLLDGTANKQIESHVVNATPDADGAAPLSCSACPCVGSVHSPALQKILPKNQAFRAAPPIPPSHVARCPAPTPCTSCQSIPAESAHTRSCFRLPIPQPCCQCRYQPPASRSNNLSWFARHAAHRVHRSRWSKRAKNLETGEIGVAQHGQKQRPILAQIFPICAHRSPTISSRNGFFFAAPEPGQCAGWSGIRLTESPSSTYPAYTS